MRPTNAPIAALLLTLRPWLPSAALAALARDLEAMVKRYKV
jgi:hypothetical protein